MRRTAKRILGIHAGLALAELICASAFVIEVHRATSGNTLSWAYVFEWPIFAGYAVYLWHRLLRDERGQAPEPRDEGPTDDDALARYNEYLDQIHEKRRDSGGVS